jgi:hypothetical protein
LKPPVLAAARATAEQISVTGRVVGAPIGRYVVELFGNADARGEAETFLGEGIVRIGDHDRDTFTVSVASRLSEKLRSITATITSHDGATSALSAAIPVTSSSSR